MAPVILYSLTLKICVATIAICFLGHPVEMLTVLAAAFVSVLLTVQFFCVYKRVKQLSGEKPTGIGQFMSVWTDT